MPNFHNTGEKMEQDYIITEHPFLSYAKQVSFPKWNVMVGELGEKFTRRNSIDRDIMGESRDSDVEKSKEVNKASFKISEDNEKMKINEMDTRSEQKLGLVSKQTPQILEMPTLQIQSRTAYEGVNTHQKVKREISDNTNMERKQIFRYCEIIKEESRESEEEITEDKENDPKPFISTVNITLKNNNVPNKIEVRPTRISRSWSNEERSSNSAMNEFDSRADNGDCCKNQFNAASDFGSHSAHGCQGAPQSTGNDDNNNMPEIQLDPIPDGPMRRLGRSMALDEHHLLPTNAAKNDVTHKHRHKGRFRKKSSSFSGALPVMIPTDRENSIITEVASKSPVLPAKHKPVRRRGTIDMGNVEMPKSPRMSGGRTKRTDPSHYLMQNMGKRRGSYNPTYDQTSLKTNRSKKHHTRAKSMHVVHSDDRHSLRERLMQHACPELRESLERDSSEHETENEQGSKDDGIIGRSSKHDGHINGYFENCTSSDLTRRKISLAKSASFNSYAGLENVHGKKKEKSTNSTHETARRRGHERKTGAFNANTEENRAMNFSSSDNEQNNRRQFARKSGVIHSNTDDNIDEQRTMKTSLSDNEINNGHLLRPHKSRSRNLRAQSSFDGVSPSQFGRLRQKSFEHHRLDRAKSDSMSSVSSSESGEIADPFPMHYLAKLGKAKKLQKMISTGKNVNVLDPNGWPPIHYALTEGHFDCVACLLNAGANITDYAKGRTSKYFK